MGILFESKQFNMQQQLVAFLFLCLAFGHADFISKELGNFPSQIDGITLPTREYELYVLGSQHESSYPRDFLPSTHQHKLLFQKNEIDQWIEGNLVKNLKNFLVKSISKGVAWLLKSGFH